MALTKRLAEDIEQDIAKPRKTTKKSKNIYDGSWSEWAELQNLKENVV